MIPNTLLTPHQSINLLNTNSLMNSNQHPTSGLNTPPSVMATPKRKRGRPPKPNNFSNKITKTINISVNTSPLSNSPDAENNSNQIVKRGIPDIFTPTMRVSPNANLKVRRRSKKSISSIDGITSPVKNRKNSYNSAQSSPANDYINSKTLDNISMITNAHPSQNANLALSGSAGVQTQMSYNQVTTHQNPYSSPPPSVKQQHMDRNDRNLLPPVLIKAEKSISPTTSTDSLDDFNDFNLRLMIDDSGKAVLSNQSQQRDRQHSEPKDDGDNAMVAAANATVVGSQSPHSLSVNSTGTVTNGGVEESQEDMAPKPRLYHANSLIGIETSYMNDLGYGQAPNQYVSNVQSQSQPQSNVAQRPVPVKFPSDFAFSENNPPQTPKPKDNYSLTGTGLTPLNSSLNYPSNNLTPQFNSLMNSIIASPKKFNSNQFMFNQEMFMGGNFNYNDYNMNNSQTLMSTPVQQSLQGQIQVNAPAQSQQQPQSQFYGYQQQGQSQLNQGYQLNDDSDARLALKKMIHVKRR